MQSFVVSPAPLTFIVDDQSMVYGGPVPALTGSYDASQLVDGDSPDGLPMPSITTTATLSSGVGSYPITASGAMLANYTVTYDPGVLTVTPAPLTVTADDQTITYGGTLPTLTVSYSGFVNGDTAASLPSTPTVTTVPANSPVGEYDIEVADGVQGNYFVEEATGTLTIAPAPLAITADDQTIPAGAALPDLTVTYAGLVNGDTPGTFAAAQNLAPLVTTTATPDSPGGTVSDITPGFAFDPNYDISYVPGTLTITPDLNLSTTTTLGTPTPSTSTFGQQVTLTATVTASVGTPTGNVQYYEGSMMIGVAPLNNGTASLPISTLPAGSQTITAQYLGSGREFLPSSSGPLTQVVQKVTPTVTWATPAAIVYGTPLSSTQLDASASVAGTFTYTPAAGTIPTVGGGQALSAVFTPDDTVDYNTVNIGTTLTVTPATLTITAKDASKTAGTVQIFSPTAFTVTGLVAANGDTVAGVTETSDGAPGSAAPGTYAIVPSAATGSGLNNYTIHYANGTLSVTPTPTPTAAPAVFLNENRMTEKINMKKVTDFVLNFNEALSSANGVYQVTQAGKTKTSRPRHVRVTSMTLGPGGTSVILRLGRHTTPGGPLTLTVSGLTSVNGQPVKAFVTRL
jgi:hypothetical protein